MVWYRCVASWYLFCSYIYILSPSFPIPCIFSFETHFIDRAEPGPLVLLNFTSNSIFWVSNHHPSQVTISITKTAWLVSKGELEAPPDITLQYQKVSQSLLTTSGSDKELERTETQTSLPDAQTFLPSPFSHSPLLMTCSSRSRTSHQPYH